MANERRLIDANALKERWTIASPTPYSTDTAEVLDTINEAPTVDAVEVVRCAQCCWNDRDGRCMNPKCGKSWYGCPVPDEHFCSYGEKRESGTQPQREDV